jgi:hypothetical protein
MRHCTSMGRNIRDLWELQKSDSSAVSERRVLVTWAIRGACERFSTEHQDLIVDTDFENTGQRFAFGWLGGAGSCLGLGKASVRRFMTGGSKRGFQGARIRTKTLEEPQCGERPVATKLQNGFCQNMDIVDQTPSLAVSTFYHPPTTAKEDWASHALPSTPQHRNRPRQISPNTTPVTPHGATPPQREQPPGPNPAGKPLLEVPL